MLEMTKQELQSSLRTCKHCDLEIPLALASQGSDFCCLGCESVYQILHTHGLENFYCIKDQVPPLRTQQAAFSSQDDFSYLDDPEITAVQINADGSKTLKFYIAGVHCAACVWLLEKLPEFLPQVEDVYLNLSTAIAKVTLQPEGDFKTVAEAIRSFGYAPHAIRSDQDAENHQNKEHRQQLLRIGVAAFSAGNLMILSVALYSGLEGSLAIFFLWISLLLAFPALTYSAWPFYKTAWSHLRHKNISIDLPIVLSIFAGTLSSVYSVFQGRDEIYFDTLTMLIFLLLLSRYTLNRIHARILVQNSFLSFYQPDYVRVYSKTENIFIERPPHTLQLGDLIEILPGERIPVDGTVIDSSSSVDESVLTGEAVPVDVQTGQDVWAGSRNLRAPLKVAVMKDISNSRLAQIIQKTQNNMLQKTEFMNITDRIARYFVAAVVGISALVWLAWIPFDMTEGFSRALTLVIISCPCALALTLPLIFSISTRRAYQKGFLIRSASALERLWNIKSVLFDKTGTLTEGRFQLLEHSGLTEEISQAICALEKDAQHPIAHTLKTTLNVSGLVVPEALDIQLMPEGGIQGWVNGCLWQIQPSEKGAATNEAPLTQLVVLKDGQALASFILGDKIHPQSAATIQKLKALDLTCGLVSGDQQAPCAYVAGKTGIAKEHIYSRQTPADKERVVNGFEAPLMIGDGANDAIALSAARVGISMKGGVIENIEAGDIHLMEGGIQPLPELLAHAQKTKSLIRLSLGASLLYNLLGVGGAILGVVTPLYAAILMPISSLTVIGIAVLGGKRL